MTRSEQLKEINSTITMIKDACSHASDISDAKYTASYVVQWLDQLEMEIEEYENMDEEQEENE